MVRPAACSLCLDGLLHLQKWEGGAPIAVYTYILLRKYMYNHRGGVAFPSERAKLFRFKGQPAAFCLLLRRKAESLSRHAALLLPTRRPRTMPDTRRDTRAGHKQPHPRRGSQQTQRDKENRDGKVVTIGRQSYCKSRNSDGRKPVWRLKSFTK